MEWWQAVEIIKPHVVQISTPRGSGTGFFVSSSASTGICAIATAAHVVSDSNWWEEPIRLFHPSSGHHRILRMLDRAIHVNHEMDTAAILFTRQDMPLPPEPMPPIDEGHFLRVGSELGWLGFPSVSPLELCFFRGTVSAWIQKDRTYLVDGVAINGVSGGPAFAIFADDRPMMFGVVSAYIPNYATGTALPGLTVVRDVNQFHELAREFKSIDEASQQQSPPQPPTP